MSSENRRRYEKKRRAEKEEATRNRIVAATAELHEEVGPAHTTIKAVADRARVTRPTVYKHFPDERTLFAACSAHFRASHAPPDPARWAEVGDPEDRLRRALVDLYGYYGRTEAMTANVTRDAETMPALREVLAQGRDAFVGAVVEILSSGWGVRGGRRRRLVAAIELAVDFGTWRRLTRGSGLSDHEAVELMLGLTRGAARS